MWYSIVKGVIKMTEKEILKYAIIGLESEIDKLENSLNVGRMFLKEYENGGNPKTPKKPYELEKIISDKKVQIKELNEKLFELKWRIEE